MADSFPMISYYYLFERVNISATCSPDKDNILQSFRKELPHMEQYHCHCLFGNDAH